MVNLTSENGVQKYGIMRYVIDTPNQLSSLPTNVEIGSTCFVISTSNNYMLNSNHQWIKVYFDGTNPSEDIIIYDGGYDG